MEDSDIKIDTFRGSGPGGQHRNKTDSCVRATHVPSGITAIATEQRSQHQNKRVALERLRIRAGSGMIETDLAVDQQWNWCEWRDQVVLPSGSKKSMKQVLRRGI